MIIINADDYGRNRLVTDRILTCFRQERITATSAMVFMEDSQRAAELAKHHGIDVGLHLNFTHALPQRTQNPLYCDYHERIVEYLGRGKYSFMIYNPMLRKQFEYVFQVQLEEFERLYGAPPSHIDGHHHMHLCANMLIETIVPDGQKVRRNLSFARGEKSLLNRTYRAAIDKWLARRYVTTDYLFSLSERINTGRLARALELAKASSVEFETHPEHTEEFDWLTGDACAQAFSSLQRGGWAQLSVAIHSGNNSSSRNE